MKQTAVEWLAETLRFANKELYAEMYEDIEQAKEMEKEQIIDAANWDSRSISENGYRKGEQYYKETFNTNEK
jgi:vacuolar-type H+-ATPase subunit H